MLGHDGVHAICQRVAGAEVDTNEVLFIDALDEIHAYVSYHRLRLSSCGVKDLGRIFGVLCFY